MDCKSCRIVWVNPDFFIYRMVFATMITLTPVTLDGRGIRLEPLVPEHETALATAASDGELWNLWYTSVPKPEETKGYIADALAGQQAGHMLPWAVCELST